jgi:hypothetical protein
VSQFCYNHYPTCYSRQDGFRSARPVNNFKKILAGVTQNSPRDLFAISTRTQLKRIFRAHGDRVAGVFPAARVGNQAEGVVVEVRYFTAEMPIDGV